MIQDEAFYKTAGQVAALEMVVKHLVAMAFVATVRNETGFPQAARAAKEAGERIRATIAPLADRLSPAHRSTDVPDIMIREMEATIARCFDQPAARLSQVADLVLRALDPASPAKN